MIAIDTNILVYAHREESPFHRIAKEKVVALAEQRGHWAVPWPCIHEFLAVVTHPKIFRCATTMKRGWEFLDALLGSPSNRLLSETPRYKERLEGLLMTSQVSGPRVHDARIAALCLDHAVTELWTADRDFSRFRGLKTVNPLV